MQKEQRVTILVIEIRGNSASHLNASLYPSEPLTHVPLSINPWGFNSYKEASMNQIPRRRGFPLHFHLLSFNAKLFNVFQLESIYHEFLKISFHLNKQAVKAFCFLLGKQALDLRWTCTQVSGSFRARKLA